MSDILHNFARLLTFVFYVFLLFWSSLNLTLHLHPTLFSPCKPTNSSLFLFISYLQRPTKQKGLSCLIENNWALWALWPLTSDGLHRHRRERAAFNWHTWGYHLHILSQLWFPLYLCHLFPSLVVQTIGTIFYYVLVSHISSRHYIFSQYGNRFAPCCVLVQDQPRCVQGDYPHLTLLSL